MKHRILMRRSPLQKRFELSLKQHVNVPNLTINRYRSTTPYFHSSALSSYPRINAPFYLTRRTKVALPSAVPDDDHPLGYASSPPREVPTPVISKQDKDHATRTLSFEAVADSSRLPKFDDPQSAHGHKSVPELIRSLAVFQMCQFPSLVQYAPKLLSLSTKYLGATLTHAVIRQSFFAQFCAGESEVSMKPTLHTLAHNGIGAILDYAAEDEADESANGDENVDEGAENNSNLIVAHPPFNQPARVYKYDSEAKCDHHVELFLDSIRTVQTCSAPGTGFAALKITALGNPLLLEQMSIAIQEADRLFAKFDADGDGIVTREEFTNAYKTFFDDDSEERLSSLLESLDPNGATNQIDYIAMMSKFLTPADLPRITAHCRSVGPMAMATPSPEEIDLMNNMHGRARTIAQFASECGVRLLIDAEHFKYQPAIDHLALELQRSVNDVDKTNVPIVFQTYQCYLKDSFRRIQIDLERSKRFGYHFAAKVVRGAYRIHESERARERGEECPVFSTIEETHACYDQSVEYLLTQMKNAQDQSIDLQRREDGVGYVARHRSTKDKSKIEVMCATHNQRSIEKAIALMERLGLHTLSGGDLSVRGDHSDGSSRPEQVVHFAQLYGMCDHLTYPLGKHNYSAYKYLPYGPIDEVIPYLLRRAQENSDVLGNAGKEKSLLKGELKRRFLGMFGL